MPALLDAWTRHRTAPAAARFVALDFETADYEPDSACALAVIRVEGLRVVRREVKLIRPPRQRIVFSYLHGITWEMVADQPSFASVWAAVAPLLDGAAFIAAHNAPFDHGVLAACCHAAGMAPPSLPFVCTVQVARRTWGIYPTKLPNVCGRLGIPLRHHDAGSDAEACAEIVIRSYHGAAAARESALPSLPSPRP